MKLGIALSGGGIRGIAHAGALQALEENNIKPDIIGGTSCGSMIASLYAMGYSPYHIYLLFKRYARDIAKFNAQPVFSGIHSCIFKKKIMVDGFNNGEKIEELYDRAAHRRGIYNINQIKMPLIIPTVDMSSGKECVITNYIPNSKNKNDKSQSEFKVYIDNISVGKAVRASSSFPGFYSPYHYKEYTFMDGGALNNIPVDEVKLQGADKVIAFKFHADEVEEDSNVMDVVMKSLDIMGNKISEKSLQMSDLNLDIYTDKVGLLDVEKLDKCYQYGYEAVIAELDKIKELL